MKPGNLRHGLQQARDVVARITAEQLVGAFAGQHHRHVLAGELAHGVDVHRVGEVERQVVMPDEARQQLGVLALVDPQLMMVGAAGLGREARIGALVVVGLVKTHRERVDGLRRRVLQQSPW